MRVQRLTTTTTTTSPVTTTTSPVTATPATTATTHTDDAAALAALAHGAQRREALPSTSSPTQTPLSTLLAAKTAATTKTLTVTKVPSLQPEVFLPLLAAHLARQGFQGTRLYLRFVDSERLPQALKTGNDRDASSTLYDVPNADCTAAERAKAGVRPEQVTYTHTVILDGVTPLIQVGDAAVPLADHLREMAPYSSFSSVLVYDPAKTLANGSLVERWLPKDGRSAVLGVFSAA